MQNKDVIAQLEDGTIVDDDDFFQTVPQQTLIILSRDGEIPTTGKAFVVVGIIENQMIRFGIMLFILMSFIKFCSKKKYCPLYIFITLGMLSNFQLVMHELIYCV